VSSEDNWNWSSFVVGFFCGVVAILAVLTLMIIYVYMAAPPTVAPPPPDPPDCPDPPQQQYQLGEGAGEGSFYQWVAASHSTTYLSSPARNYEGEGT